METLTVKKNLPSGGTSSLTGKNENATRIEPISVRIKVATSITGLSRSRLYQLIKSGELEIVKDRSSTLIVFESLREIIERRRSG